MESRRRFVASVQPPREPFERAFWFAFQHGDLVLKREGDALRVPEGPSLEATGLPPGRAVSIGSLDGVPLFAVELDADAVLSDGFSASGLRALSEILDDEIWWAAAYAGHIEHWIRTSRFCPQCGARAQPEEESWGRHCPVCGFCHYPPVSPCIIVLIHDGRRLLMTRKSHYPKGVYGLVSGFVEPGESLEECLRREVREEVGVEVEEIRYFDSQPWPFPHQLMVGYFARHADGELKQDEQELEDAGWFALDDLPLLPARHSLARRMVEHFVAESDAGGD